VVTFDVGASSETQPASKPAINLLQLPSATLPTTTRPAISGTEQKSIADLYPETHFDYTPQTIELRCKEALSSVIKALDAIVAKHPDPSKATFSSAVVPMEAAIAQYDAHIGVPYLLKYTSPNAEIRKQAETHCLLPYFNFVSTVFSRTDLYLLIQHARKNAKDLDAVDQKLLEDIFRSFVRKGAALDQEKREKVIAINKKISALGIAFHNNITNDNTTIALTAAELEGVPEAIMSRLEKDKEGRYLLRLRLASNYLSVMQNALDANTRRRVLLKFENIQGDTNTKIIEEILELRYQMASLLGYETFAHFVLEERMAKNPQNVFQFLNKLKNKVKLHMAKELAKLLELKRKEDPAAHKIEPWDWRYYTNLLKKTEYAVDEEEVRQYFPLNHVVTSTFEIYQQLFNLRFDEISPARAWHEDVRLFAIRDQSTKQILAHFYLDLFPRPGKYSHFAAFTIIGGQELPNNTYRRPVSAIVGNWPKPIGKEQPLLNTYQVTTFFHEFGHIVHQTLTRARYGMMAGTKVQRDFVEVPSQMLENWVWQPSMLKRMSRHHKTGQPMPDDLIVKMIRAKNMNVGLFTSRQLLFAAADMRFHSEKGRIDTAKIWGEVMLDVMPVGYSPNTRQAANFGHLIGYAAGYYGYLWSKVYALDMFSEFAKKGLLNTELGKRYRQWILEPGGTRDPFELIRGFLGREPTFDAFYRDLGITP
jgi:thimet oligopeptidase